MKCHAHKFTNKMYEIHENFNMLMLITLSLQINVTTYVVHNNIKFMQKLEHA